MDTPGSESQPPALGGEDPEHTRPPRTGPRRRPLRLALAAAMAVAGLVWIGQGLGILTAGRSFMIGDPTWAWIGAAFVALGLFVAAREWRR